MSLAVLYYPGRGWLFINPDGVLCCANYDPEHWTLGDPESYPDANGWEVEEVKLEWWGREFPPDKG